MGSQGFPVQAYTRISNGLDVFQILDDGSLVLINGLQITTSDGSPDGGVVAPEGSLAIDFTTPAIWQNQDGDTSWSQIGGGGGGGGVTSFKGRTGAVIPEANDYASVSQLQLSDGAGEVIFFDDFSQSMSILNAGQNQIILGPTGLSLLSVIGAITLNPASKVEVTSNIAVGPDESVLPAPIQGWTGAPNLVVSNNLSASIAGGAFGIETHYSDANGGNAGAISAVAYGDQTSDGPGSLSGIGVNGANFWGLINTDTHTHGNVYGVIAGAGMAAGTGNPDLLAAYIAWPLFVGGSGVPIVACDYYSRGPSPDGSSISAGFYAPNASGRVSTYATFRSDQTGSSGGFAFLASDSTSMSKFGKVAGGANMRGTVTSGGGTTVSVTYANAYAATPVVVVTPTSNCGTFFISAQSASGFTITYQTSGVQSFNWIAIA